MKVDYFTGSVQPCTSGLDPDELLDLILDALYITEWRPYFQDMGAFNRYEHIYRYSNVSVKIPYSHYYEKTGIVIEMSGSGVDYYSQYLMLHHNVRLHTAFNRFRALCVKGVSTKCSRFDIAVDDKAYRNENPLLDLDKIELALKNHLFVSKFRKSDPCHESGEVTPFFTVRPEQADQSLPYQVIQSCNLSTGRVGKTIYLGKRSSNSMIRIYDKLAESEAKGVKDLPSDLTSWVRFEIEFKRLRAGAVFAKYCDCNDDKVFARYFARYCYDLIRFIDPDHSRIYNCTVSAWWLGFLGDMAEQRMTINRMSRNRYIAAQKHAFNALASMVYALAYCDENNYYNLLAIGREKNSKSKEAIISDYSALRRLGDDELHRVLMEDEHTLSGVEYWKMFDNGEDFEQRIDQIYSDVFKSSVLENN